MIDPSTIWIVIAVHNRVAFTRACLTALRAGSIQGFHVIVVDDGSIDGTARVLSRDFPEVDVTVGDGNLWWPCAMNLGFKRALEQGAQYLLSLNNDTEPRLDYLEKMIYWAEKHPLALFGSLALDSSSAEPVYGGETFNWRTAGTFPLLPAIPPDRRYGLFEVTHFPGRGLWIPRQVFEQVGMLCEYWPMTHSDIDFTFRASRAGYRIYCNYDAKLAVRVEESAQWFYDNQFSLRNYWRRLTDRKSAANLRYRMVFGLRNAPRDLRVRYLALTMTRCIFGYWVHWLGSEVSRLRACHR